MNHVGATLGSRERVRRAIALATPDRVPITHATLPGAHARYGAALTALYERYPDDTLAVGSVSEGEWGPEIGVPSRDLWGSQWVRTSDEHKGQVVWHPLADWDALPRYRPPDTSSARRMAALEDELAHNGGRTRHGGRRYTLADGDTLWQRMFYLHGFESTLEDLLLHPDRCADLRDLILATMLRHVEALCRVPELDGIHFRDDWGTQEALMISPSLWRSFFKPAYARLFALARDAGKQVWFHSDGAIATIIGDLLEIGVQVLNPQVPVIGRQELASLCQGRACVQADIDRQWVLPFGTPEDVRLAARADMAAFARPTGGYIARGEMAGEVPLENLQALFEEVAGS